MGRGKLSMELISKEKSRKTTYNKRKMGVKKKTYEFSTLCDVDACSIIYGTDQAQPEIWPENPDEVRRIIYRYKSYSKEEREKRSLNLSNFYEDQTKKLQEEVTKVRRQNDEAQYPTSDDQFKDLSIEDLKKVLPVLDAKLEKVKIRIEMLKRNQSFNGGIEPFNGIPFSSQNQSPSCLNPLPLDQYLHVHDYSFNPIISNGISFENPMMPFNSIEYSNFNTGSYNNNHQLCCSPLSVPFDQYQIQEFGSIMENKYDDTGPSTLCFDTNNMQGLVPYMQGFPSQMDFNHFDGLYDYQDFHMRGKRPRF